MVRLVTAVAEQELPVVADMAVLDYLQCLLLGELM
jgi:hypothetical protein